jgi:hypothetical protein
MFSVYYIDMGALEDAKAVLQTAEQKLRTILVQAAEAGDYDHLPRIAEWAKVVNIALGGLAATDTTPAPNPSIPRSLLDNDAGPPMDDFAGSAPRRAPVARIAGRRKKPRKKVKKDGYPNFIREGNTLVKIAWSKTEGKPYEHKAPRGVLRALIQAITRVGADGERFTMEGLLPLKDGGTEIPDYQTYLALAWLRRIGLITQHGRQGYSLPQDTDLDRETDRQWSQLATR